MGELAQHWIDVLVATLIAIVGGLCLVIGYFLKRDISGFEERHARHEDNFKQQDGRLDNHEVEIRHIQHETKVDPFDEDWDSR